MKPVWVPALLIFIHIAIQLSDAELRTIELSSDKECDYKPIELRDGDRVRLMWDNTMEKNCRVNFKGVGDDITDLYKVCVKTLSYSLPTCNVKLTYSGSGFPSDVKTYQCHDYPESWCLAPGARLYIHIGLNSTLLQAFLPSVLVTPTDSIQLEIYSEKVYTAETAKRLGLIVGAAGGGLAGLVILCIFMVCIIQHVRSKKRERAESRDREHQLVLGTPRGQPHISDSLIQPTAPATTTVDVERDLYKSDLSDHPPPSYAEVMAQEQESMQCV